ncbi:MAG: ATP-binding protein, partial [Rhodopila sp.]
AQRDADRGTFISRAYVGAQSGQPDFALSRRRTTPDGSFDGTVHVAVTAAYFSDFWSAVVAGRNDIVIELVRSDGEVLAHLPETGGILPPLSGQDSPLMHQIDADPRGSVFRARSATDGVDRICAYSRVGNYPLVVGYGVTVRSVIAPWRQHMFEIGGVAVLATAALVIAVLAIMQQVQRLIAEQARRVAIEQQVHEGQRLKLLGQFAAGVAHDFANILQAMEVVATMLKRAAGQPERVRSLADRLAEDVQRGASLTHRMLDLVRHNGGPGKDRDSEPIGVINPVEAMSRVSEMLPRFLGHKHRLRFELLDDLPASMQGNPAEFELAVMNLTVNARDAMPDGGEIFIQVASERVGEAFGDLGGVHHRVVLAPGPYIRISVSDKGVGMCPEVLAQAGELFFTTKPPGRGTGLGLAGARGFAERAGGNLSIESEEGHGTTVTIWLPAIKQCPAPGSRPVEQVG